jgi:hypothetical protein
MVGACGEEMPRGSSYHSVAGYCTRSVALFHSVQGFGHLNENCVCPEAFTVTEFNKISAGRQLSVSFEKAGCWVMSEAESVSDTSLHLKSPMRIACYCYYLLKGCSEQWTGSVFTLLEDKHLKLRNCQCCVSQGLCCIYRRPEIYFGVCCKELMKKLRAD